MATRFENISALLAHGFDTLVDVRSPAEFASDHVPGAINLPALSNQERHEIGTIYTQVSPFTARKKGAALVARNVADHVDTALADYDGSWRPLVYCWRGGQRSGSFSIILQQIGWRADTLDGGYMQWRGLVKKALYDEPVPHRLVLLDGNTGTAKTALLAQLAENGVQVIDLEGLARHRGSLLGAMPEGQPDQKGFETLLAVALAKCDPTKPTVLEAESSKIGQINIPPSVWQAMQKAPRIMITATIDDRADFLQNAYADMIADPVELSNRLEPLRSLRGHNAVDRWLSLLAAKDFRSLAKALMEDHYDAAYDKSRNTDTRDFLRTIHADNLKNSGQKVIAQQIMVAIQAL